MAGEYNITIKQGSDDQNIIIKVLKTAYDLTDHTAGMQIRPSKSSSTILDSLTTENSRITIESDGDYWKTTLKFPSATTSSYCWDNGVYDLEFYSDTTPVIVWRMLEGTVSINKEVTR